MRLFKWGRTLQCRKMLHPIRGEGEQHFTLVNAYVNSFLKESQNIRFQSRAFLKNSQSRSFNSRITSFL